MGAEKVDTATIEQKLKDNEPLTAAELKEVMSAPPEGFNGAIAPEDDLPESHFVADPEKKDDKPAGDAPGEAAKAPGKDDKPKDDAKPGSEGTDDHMARLQRELAKPDGQEDLKGWTKAETAYFWEMKRERKARQKAEQDLDVRKRADAKKAIDEKKAQDDAAAKEVDDVLKDKDPEDTVKVKDVQKILEGQKKLTAKDTDRPQSTFDPTNRIVAAALKIQEEATKKELDDYDAVMAHVDTIVGDNPEYLEQISTALQKGENVAKLTYTLIKGDPEYAKVAPKPSSEKKPAGQAPDAEALAAQEKLEKNKDKTKTSAHVPGEQAGGEGATYGKYSAQELMNMSDRDFAKVPKKDRDAFLKDIG